MSTCQDEDLEANTMSWKPRCPKCFSRALDFNIELCIIDGIDPSRFTTVNLGLCKDCGSKFDMKDAELTMPMTGGYMDVPKGAEEEIR